MRRRTIACLLLGIAWMVSLPVQPASANHRPEPHFRDTWCDPSDIDYIEYDEMTRDGSRSYASTAIGDGYQWGGGCWNSSHHDDQPNDPPQQAWTGGEGGDCSGFVFKSWYLSKNTSEGKFHWRHPLRYEHGPYTASAFKSGGGYPITSVEKKNVRMMDAFASSGHIGLIQTPSATPDGQDMILEAKSEADGSGVWPRAYRSNPSYTGVQRRFWREPSIGCLKGCRLPAARAA